MAPNLYVKARFTLPRLASFPRSKDPNSLSIWLTFGQGFSCFTEASQRPTPGGGGGLAAANLTASGLAILSQLGQIGDRYSEDCLTLNVWVPSGGEQNKAVMLWIYGGGFSTGSTSITTYNGQNIAAQEDVIVVSIK